MLIKKYTTEWIQHYIDIKNEIDKGLGGLNYDMEHVGSTSIPQLDAKPIIDIDVIFENVSDFENLKKALIKLGYFHRGNQGIEHREVFKRSGTSQNNVLDSLPHHLYVCQKDSAPLLRHLLMRDFLRKNEGARENYQEMKYKLAENAKQDKKRYAQLKEKYANDLINEWMETQKQSLKIDL